MLELAGDNVELIDYRFHFDTQFSKKYKMKI